MSRRPPYDVKAGKQTISLTINSDLVSQAKRLGINASRVAETALAQEVAHRRAQQVAAEIKQDLEAVDAYGAKHGSFAEMVRDHYGDGEQD